MEYEAKDMVDSRIIKGKKRYYCSKCGEYAAVSKGKNLSKLKCEAYGKVSTPSSDKGCYTANELLVLKTILTLFELWNNNSRDIKSLSIADLTKYITSQDFEILINKYRLSMRELCNKYESKECHIENNLDDFMVMTISDEFNIEFRKDLLQIGQAVELKDCKLGVLSNQKERFVQEELEKLEKSRLKLAQRGVRPTGHGRSLLSNEPKLADYKTLS